jgi:RNA polymerase-binding transcription factor DksA
MARTTTNAAATKKSGKSNGQLDKFLESQLQLLEDERVTYTRQAETLQAEADSLTEDREPGDVQFDEESGEGDTLAVERERDLALSAQARAAIEEIDRAIEKVHDGTYGQCESCGIAIPKERLKALPHAALCVKCKSGGLGLRG